MRKTAYTSSVLTITLNLKIPTGSKSIELGRLTGRRKMEWYESFQPVIDKNSKILILGSFPSVKSREQGFYYGHKQNRFWKTLERALNKPVPENIDGKIKFLLENKIALWDVIEKSCITGSSDADINLTNSVPVNIENLLEKYSDNIISPHFLLSIGLIG